jgi:hypothetical protein
VVIISFGTAPWNHSTAHPKSGREEEAFLATADNHRLIH